MDKKDDKRATYIFENQKLIGKWFCNQSFENRAMWSAGTDTHKDWTIQCNMALFME